MDKLVDNGGLLISENVYDMSRKADLRKFKKLIKNKRKRNGEKMLATRELAAMLDISHEMLQKILNRNKPTKKRDCIIAICAMLQMNSDETNKALTYYDHMAVLNEKYTRDSFLIDILNNQSKEFIGIDKINERLVRNQFPPLDIIDKRVGARKHKEQSSYKVLKKRVRTVADDLIFGDRYESLATKYSLGRYRCQANMILEDCTNQKQYELWADSLGKCIIEVMPWSENSHREFNSVEDTGEFKDCFLELQAMINREYLRMADRISDTRNYGERIGADIRNHRIHVYIEKYNYTLPEMNEYYFMEYIDGEYHLSVSHNSRFMQHYLSEEKYTKMYREYYEPFVRYDSLAQIEELIEEKRNSYELTHIMRLRKNAFIKLKQQIEQCISGLRQKKIFVQNYDQIWGASDEVCSWYNVCDEFACEINEDAGFRIAKRSEFVFVCDGKDVCITLSDLKRAFELGFKNIQEICTVKLNNGSVEAVLQ